MARTSGNCQVWSSLQGFGACTLAQACEASEPARSLSNMTLAPSCRGNGKVSLNQGKLGGIAELWTCSTYEMGNAQQLLHGTGRLDGAGL